MFFTRFIFFALAFLALFALLLKSFILLWSPASFASLTAFQQAEALLWGTRFDLAAAALLWTALFPKSAIRLQLPQPQVTATLGAF